VGGCGNIFSLSMATCRVIRVGLPSGPPGMGKGVMPLRGDGKLFWNQPLPLRPALHIDDSPEKQPNGYFLQTLRRSTD
jgi:hypothetical protein